MLEGEERHERFLKCLSIGERFEKRYIEYLRALGFKKACKAFSTSERWDVCNPALGEFYELKVDELSKKTGNVFIECRGKHGNESGISKSWATHWVICCYYGGWKVLKTNRRDLQAIMGNYSMTVSSEGATGYLVPVGDVLALNSTKVEELTKKEGVARVK